MNYHLSRVTTHPFFPLVVVGGAGFEPAKALPSDLQSDPFDRSGNPPFSGLTPQLVSARFLPIGLVTIYTHPSLKPKNTRKTAQLTF